MENKYLLLGALAILAAWYFFRDTEDETPNTEPEEETEEEEETTTTKVIPGTSLRGSRTTAGLEQPNRSGRGKGTTNNRRSGEASITYEPIVQHYEPKIYIPKND